MKINIAGASGTGKTTLATALANRLDVPMLDSDQYYWLPTDPPFTTTRPVEDRRRLLRADFDRHPTLVLSGAMTGSWGSDWDGDLDLVVFLLLPPEVRMDRLRAREEQRYGAALRNDAPVAANSAEFLEWAASYDTSSDDPTSRNGHEAWLAGLTCPVLRLESTSSVEVHVERIVAHIEHSQTT